MLKNISFFSRIYLLSLLFLLNACADVKKALIHDYPKQLSFVYENKIVIKGAENNTFQQALNNELNNYWDDSLKVKRIRQFGVFNTLIDPIPFQIDRIPRTIHYMQSFLASKGYNQSVLTPIIKTDTIHKEWRTHITMLVQLNKKTLLDSIRYELSDKKLQQIALANRGQSYLKKGAAFSQDNINNELDRLVTLFRSEGFYHFTKEKLVAEIDTIDQSLMLLNLDPIAQINQVTSAANTKNQNPSWKVSIQLRNMNESISKQYHVGQQIFYSDLKMSDNPDSILTTPPSFKEHKGDVTHSYHNRKFKSSLFDQQSYIRKGELFNENRYFQTLNNFNGLGAWQQIDGRTTIKNDSVYLHYFLLPSLRKSYSFDIEGSKNTSQISAGNLLGLSASFTYRDKNVAKKSIASLTNFRMGIELNMDNSNQNLTQTLLWNVGHTYSFPSILIPFKSMKNKIVRHTRTLFSINSAYIDRLDYYKLNTFTTSWGYELKKNKLATSSTWIYRPFNIEFYQINKFSKLDSLLLLNPFLRSSFNEGNVISQTLSYIYTGSNIKHPRQNTYLRIGLEEAGGLLGMTSLKSNIYRYIKVEAELRKLYKYDYSELAWRIMGGWGNNYSSQTSLSGQLPFFKQYTSGGPYSMRAWGLRQLGLGSSTFYDTSAQRQSFDRFGDLQLETNLEYRFPLFQWGSYKVGSAIFTDIGNIWNTRDTKQDPNAGFKLNRLFSDLAIAVGTGIRFDFNYFIVRIDYALKMKDPTRLYNSGWLDFNHFKWTEIKPNGIVLNNYAWQFGIGLPF